MLPILLELKEFASALRDKPNLELESFVLSRFDYQIPNLKERLASGRILMLLDGLDEVFDESNRNWVSEQAWKMLTRFPEVRFLITSRPHGYYNSPLPGPLSIWLLQPFDEEGVRRFLVGWFEALARAGAEKPTLGSPRQRARELASAILGQPSLRELAQNPLLCTLIVLVHRSRSDHLPQRRAEFYEAAIRTLSEVWERTKHHPKQGQRLIYPEPEILRRALAEVAWRALQQLGGREIPGAELRAWLTEFLSSEPLWHYGTRGEGAVRDLLMSARDRAGLLVDLGGDNYQFLHFGLHEWLVAFYVLDRMSEAKIRKLVRHYLHAPEWDEVLVILHASAPQALATLLIENLVEQPTSEMEAEIRRDLLFICACIGDGTVISQRVRNLVIDVAVRALDDPKTIGAWGLIPSLARLGRSPEIARKVRQLMLEGPEEFSYAGDKYFLDNVIDDEENREAFLSILHQPDYWTNEFTAVSYFEKIGLTERPLLETVLDSIPADYQELAQITAKMLLRVPLDRTYLETRLVEALTPAGPEHLRPLAINYFKLAKSVMPAVKPAVVALLADESAAVRWAALQFVRSDATTREEALPLVLKCLSDNDFNVYHDTSVRSNCCLLTVKPALTIVSGDLGVSTI